VGKGVGKLNIFPHNPQALNNPQKTLRFSHKRKPQTHRKLWEIFNVKKLNI